MSALKAVLIGLVVGFQVKAFAGINPGCWWKPKVIQGLSCGRTYTLQSDLELRKRGSLWILIPTSHTVPAEPNQVVKKIDAGTKIKFTTVKRWNTITNGIRWLARGKILSPSVQTKLGIHGSDISLMVNGLKEDLL